MVININVFYGVFGFSYSGVRAGNPMYFNNYKYIKKYHPLINTDRKAELKKKKPIVGAPCR